jgi:2-polyprenyl-3-methyl-5-hydroxy-6-metoxy-1,4-benzoquinol methylase
VELTLDGLRAQYDTGPAFTGAYLDYFRHTMKTLDTDRLGPAPMMWLEYALSCVKRGRDLVRAIDAIHPLQGARFLDVGCGFGGVLVAASERGAHPTGIEIDTRRLGFTRDNLRDFGLEWHIAALDFSATDPGLTRAIGYFDVITCNDVAEHVDDVHALAANLGALLNPGGMAYLEIPNRDAVDFVAADGHFSLFGITLLQHEQARAYHRQAFQTPVYDVGEYYSLEEYGRIFASHGLRARLIPSLYHPARPMDGLDEELRHLDEAAACFALTGVLRDLVLEKYARYRERLAADRESLPADDFRERYLRSFWTFIAEKS